MYKQLVIVSAIVATISACSQERVDHADAHERGAAAHLPAEKQAEAVAESPVIAVQPVAPAYNRALAGITADSAMSKQTYHRGPPMPGPDPRGWAPENRENYLSYTENLVQSVIDNPVSTFSVDVDTAAYSNVRRMLEREGRLPPAAAVKAEEFINYFDYEYELPQAGEAPFSIHSDLAVAPWNSNAHILRIGLQGYAEPEAERPPANLVFLIDVSGSMQAPFKLGLVKNSLRMLVNQLGPEDRVALVVYAGAAGLVLESTPADQRATIMAAIDGLEAGGSTNGGAGIRLAYNVAAQHLIKDGINRVLIASDGDLNVGTTSIEALQELVSREKQRGIALTTLGFGSGNYNYALMEQIAAKGDGNAAYIDTLKEARKVLVRELGSTLETIAADVKIQVEFNPAQVSEYRLIGYENRLLNREDFNNDKVDAGDIGAGHRVTALYEVILKGATGQRLEPLRYATTQADADSNSSELAYIKLRYKRPGESHSNELVQVVSSDSVGSSIAQMDQDYRFAVGVAGFAQLLRGGKYTGDWGYEELLPLLETARGQDRFGYRAEMLALVELSRDLGGTSIQ